MNIKARAEKLLANLCFGDTIEQDLKRIEQALIEAQNEAVERCAAELEKYHVEAYGQSYSVQRVADDLRTLKVGVGK